MVKRAIHLFPNFQHSSVIQKLREKYDPLYSFIPPHITLVFPFESLLETSQVKEHMRQAVLGVGPFEVTLRGITGAEGGYLFLNVKRGNDEIIKLHDQLYSSSLENYLYRNITYVPHLTVGRLNNKESFEAALTETKTFQLSFETVITEVVSEIISPNEESIIECKVPL